MNYPSVEVDPDSLLRQYLLKVKESTIQQWFSETYERKILYSIGRIAFTKQLDEMGIRYWNMCKKQSDKYYTGIKIVLKETSIRDVLSDPYEDAEMKQTIAALEKEFPQLFNRPFNIYVREQRAKYNKMRMVERKKEEEEVQVVEEATPVWDEKEDIRLVPIATTKSYPIEERCKKMVSVGGQRLDYADLHGHIILIYKDASHLAVVTDCSGPQGSDSYEENHPAVIERLYAQLINYLFDCLAPRAIVTSSGRTLVMGANYERFQNITDWYINENVEEMDEISISFSCLCDDDSHDKQDYRDFSCSPNNLSLFLFNLCEFINSNIERPLKKAKTIKPVEEDKEEIIFKGR